MLLCFVLFDTVGDGIQKRDAGSMRCFSAYMAIQIVFEDYIFAIHIHPELRRMTINWCHWISVSVVNYGKCLHNSIVYYPKLNKRYAS